MNTKQRKILSITFPELVKDMEQKAKEEFLLQEIDRKAAQGEKGDTIIGPEGPVGPQGPRGKQGEQGNDGRDGYTPIKGVDYFDGEDGISPNPDEIIEKVIERIPQPDIIVDPETPEQIANKLNTLKEAVDVSVIKGAVATKELVEGMAKVDGRLKLIDQRWHGAGLSRVSTDSTLTGNGTPSSPLSVVPSGNTAIIVIIPTGTVNGINTSFTFSTAPNVIVRDGVTMQKVSSDSTANWSGTTSVVLLIAPNFDLYGL